MEYMYIIYFLAGALEDFLLTLNWRFVAKEKAVPAAAFSFLTTLVGMIVLYNILSTLDNHHSIFAIITYALGIRTGTFTAMKFNPDFRVDYLKTKLRLHKRRKKKEETPTETLMAPLDIQTPEQNATIIEQTLHNTGNA